MWILLLCILCSSSRTNMKSCRSQHRGSGSSFIRSFWWVCRNHWAFVFPLGFIKKPVGVAHTPAETLLPDDIPRKKLFKAAFNRLCWDMVLFRDPPDGWKCFLRFVGVPAKRKVHACCIRTHQSRVAVQIRVINDELLFFPQIPDLKIDFIHDLALFESLRFLPAVFAYIDPQPFLE